MDANKGSAGGAQAGNNSKTTSHRRNSSSLFASLEDQKRSNDPAQMARRQSMSEQRPPAGFIGQMWQNFVHGSTTK